MGVSAERFRQHVEEWSTRLINYRSVWPAYLFRHEPLENAIAVLERGSLLSRAQAEAEGIIATDIAPQEIIANRDLAHELVRLYFRPRTPTQYRIEGIRKPEDYYSGKHAGFLVMFVFDGAAILTMPDTQFSDGNMQSHGSEVYGEDAGFDKLLFSNIYHDQAYPTPEQIRQRCAEVLPVSPLALENVLKHIVVRTHADEQTICYFLQERGLDHFLPLVTRTQGTGTFFNEYTALEFIDSEPGRINFSVKYSKSAGEVAIRMKVSSLNRAMERTLFDTTIGYMKKYYFEHGLPDDFYRVSVELENCVAHESILRLY